jgi:DNA-binding IclR family transcriptional regulator
MHKSLLGVRRRGFAVMRGPLRKQPTVGIAAPFFGPDGSVAGCLCIVAPESRCPAAREATIGKALTAQALRLSKALRRASTEYH